LEELRADISVLVGREPWVGKLRLDGLLHFVTRVLVLELLHGVVGSKWLGGEGGRSKKLSQVKDIFLQEFLFFVSLDHLRLFNLLTSSGEPEFPRLTFIKVLTLKSAYVPEVVELIKSFFRGFSPQRQPRCFSMYS